MRTLPVVIFLLLATVSACKPKHYYVLCKGEDENGWRLTSTEYEEGYLMACTYVSPDGMNAYTARCRKHGCE